jgi:hypothetical protein
VVVKKIKLETVTVLSKDQDEASGWMRMLIRPTSNCRAACPKYCGPVNVWMWLPEVEGSLLTVRHGERHPAHEAEPSEGSFGALNTR